MSSEVDKLNSANKFLITVVVVIAFFLGSLTNKIASLEKGAAPSAAAGNVKQAPQGDSSAPSAANKKPKAVSASDHIKGNKDAKITLITYTDFECPFCKSFNSTEQELLNTYGDKIRIVLRHYPLSFHANAQKEAEASECVAQLGGNDAFWKYADAIFERTTSGGTGFALDKLGPLAAEAGVNQQQFQSCLDSGEYTQKIKNSFAEATAEGVQGTPATFVIDSKNNSQLVVGAQPADSFKTIIDKL